MFTNLRNYVDNNDLEIHMYKNGIYIINYNTISSFNDSKIELNDKRIIVEGSKLVITKLKKDELFISGIIDIVKLENGK